MSLGYQPVQQSLTLSIGANFVHTLTPGTTPYPVGMTAWITVLAANDSTVLDTWNATVTTSTASWSVPTSSTNPIPSGARYRLYALLPGSPNVPELWFYGPVVRAE